MPASIWRLVWLALCGLTLLLFGAASGARWQPAQGDLVAETELQDASHTWRHSAAPFARGARGRFELSVDEEHPLAFALQRVPLGGHDRVRVRGRVQTGEFDGKGEPPSQLRIVAVSLDDAQNSLYRLPHRAVTVNEDSDWVEFERVLNIWRGVHTVDFGVHLQGASGRALVEDLELTPVREATPFRLARQLLLSGWLLFLGIGARRLWQTTPRALARLALFTMLAGTFAGCCLPAPWSQSIYRGIHEVVDDVRSWSFEADQEAAPPSTAELEAQENIPTLEAIATSFFLVKRIVKKGGHFLFFALLAIAFAWSRSHDRHRIITFGLRIGITTELLQFFCFARTPGVLDVGIDLAGTLAGMVLYRLAVARWRKPRDLVEFPDQAEASRAA